MLETLSKLLKYLIFLILLAITCRICMSSGYKLFKGNCLKSPSAVSSLTGDNTVYIAIGVGMPGMIILMIVSVVVFCWLR